jgi:adenylate cyclase
LIDAKSSFDPRSFLRGIGIRQVRLACGFILFSYLLSHFTNHSLGNISLAAMEYGLWFHVTWWQSPLGTLLLYPALAIHASLGLWALYGRRHFRWKTIELIQLGFGLSIPALLCTHLIGQRIALAMYGLQKGYTQVLYNLWVARPDYGVMQVTVLVVAWIHGCIGLYLWLRMKRFFPRVAPLLLGVAVLLPVLALLGFYQAGRTVVEMSKVPEWQTQNLGPAKFGTAAQRANLVSIRDNFLIAYAGAIGLIFVARGVRAWRERRRGLVRLTYPDRTIRVPRGLSVLEASFRYKVPHASVCGGKGRCSTCRIRIIGDRSGLPRPSSREAFVLDRVGASVDPAVRLACQLRPQTDISLVPILSPQANTAFMYGKSRTHLGEERYVVCMFIDMRGSTKMAEKRLPFDTVFIINRFLAAVSQAVIEAGGQPNQYLGDGLFALFGLDTDPATAARQALNAAAMVVGNVDHLNRVFAEAERDPIRFGIGMHAGEVIVGDIGYRDAVVFTALGDTVNVTARLEAMTKDLGCEAVLSDELCRKAGIAADVLPSREVAIRGRADPLIVRTVANAAMLANLIGSRAAESAAASVGKGSLLNGDPEPGGAILEGAPIPPA